MPLRTADDIKQGDVLAGKYRVERVIGVGGMGVVVAAQHLELGTRFAVKLLRSDVMAADQATERFAREARAASRLRSQHAIHVYDVGKHSDGTPFMVMEYLTGRDLETLLAAQGRFDVGMAVGCVLQACEAIAEAHSIGIIHRDLKPTNLFLTQRIDGSPLVKVLDFGIAKRVAPEAINSLTGEIVVGSPCYMSPEQMRAYSPVDVRSDIWSLGVCLYQLLTGSLPFGGDSPLETCAMVMKDEPVSPGDLRPDLPPDLAEVVMRCLRKAPAERFQDVGVLAKALEPFASLSDWGAAARIRQILETPPVANGSLSAPAMAPPGMRTTTETLRPRRGFSLGIVAGVGLLGLAVAIFWIRPRISGREVQPLKLQQPQREPSLTASPIETTSAVPVTSLPLAQPPPAKSEAVAPPFPAMQAKRLRTIQAPPAEIPRPASDHPQAADLASDALPIATTVTISQPAATSPPTPVAAAPVSSSSLPPPFAVQSARVQIGAPASVVGTTATNISKTLGSVAPQMTACYRAALPRMSAPFDGAGTLHLETNEEGVIIGAQLSGPLTAAVGSCIAGAIRGRVIPSVDTGRARADVPLVFMPR